jgi:predicted ATPase
MQKALEKLSYGNCDISDWEEIYVHDTERKQDRKEVKDTYHVMKNIYEEFGYETITVPCLPVEKRVRWIIERIEGQAFQTEGD